MSQVEEVMVTLLDDGGLFPDFQSGLQYPAVSEEGVYWELTSERGSIAVVRHDRVSFVDWNPLSAFFSDEDIDKFKRTPWDGWTEAINSHHKRVRERVASFTRDNVSKFLWVAMGSPGGHFWFEMEGHRITWFEHELLLYGHRIRSIKEYRSRTLHSLKESKKVIDVFYDDLMLRDEVHRKKVPQ